ncbi:MAG: amidohydrolase family protein [Bacteroidales bacterium]|nr:amidohydrolase family protein [Bacteroidales bacterium]
MNILLKNATFIHWDTLHFEAADILVSGKKDGEITLMKPGQAETRGQKIIDCSNKLVTKSFAVGHHHVYSALARGMAPPPKSPENFLEILKYIWWTLDKCLDEESIRYSALVTAMAAAKAGATFVIDHHASPNCIEGSLDIIAEAFDEVGVGHLLCYEITDRDGTARAEQGLAETERYLDNRQGLVGLHASFTVGNESLRNAVEVMRRCNSGIHMHLAEDKYDQEHCLHEYYQRVTHRLNEAGVLDSPKTILVHGLHLDDEERKILAEKPCWLAQNMESNLKNKVGLFKGCQLGGNIMLGTDGMHSDMLRSARAAFFAGQIADNINFNSAYQRFRNVHRYLSMNNFSGDGDNNLVVMDYDSPTEINGQNLTGHFVFGWAREHITHVIANGRCIVEDRVVQGVDEQDILKESAIQAKRLWQRMGR